MFRYIKEQPFRIKFLFFVLILYVIAGTIDHQVALQSFQNTLVLFLKILPLLVFIFFLNALVNKYLRPEIVEKHIGEKRGWAKIFYAIILGIIISGPPYLLYPMLGDLRKKGAGRDFLAIMLFNRNVKIPFVPLMIYYFGLSYTVVVSVLIIVFSVLNGYLVMVFTEKREEM